MTEVYLKAREELIRIIRARGDIDGNIKKQEIYEVIRGIQSSALMGLSDVHSHTDIFIVGCCEFWEDAIRFDFIGRAVIGVEEAVESILKVRVNGE